jgi:ferredoxin-type protein NapF
VSANLSRRQFLRGDVASRRPAVRPPWALAEDEFLNRCDRCGKCQAACETGILIKGDGGYPQPDFFLGECNFCGACAAACPTGALNRGAARPWTLHAGISDSCLAHRGITCQVCADQCPQRAIRFPPRLGPAAVPILVLAACNGCGACVAPCPVRAVHMTTEVQ